MRIIAGTDAGFLNSFNYPGIGIHDELELFVAAGLTPLQALQSAILNGPAFLDRSGRYGAVAAGKAADLLIIPRSIARSSQNNASSLAPTAAWALARAQGISASQAAACR
ncbi:MAG: amidohydrolase family protein [Chloroflexi bacterium]|nr:amidohydrolase family protein [Chloroflexota bacterium]